MVAVTAIGLLMPGLAWSEDAVNLMDRQPTEQELIEALTPPQKTRGIKPVGREEEVQAPVQEEPIASVDLAVQFELDSAVLTDATRSMLSTLAGALQSDGLSTFNFMVEGHTDATGPDGYNMSLSERRAKAVVDYLVTQHGVNPTQLSAVGKGERELLDASNPDNGLNRRVRIRNMNAG
jgi:outer membrane protein OmpA-like peptidoglycan-associated protein